MNIEAYNEALYHYREALRKHDWFYEYSDDYRYYSKGRDNQILLEQVRKEIDQNNLIWNSFAPEGLRK